jgi:ATP-dependent helicase/nuclease subunit A
MPDTDSERNALESFYKEIEKLRREAQRISVGHLLEKILAATDYDARLLVRPNGKRRLANVRKLLQMAYASPGQGVGEFIQSLREIEKISEREGDAPTEEEAADVVRLITIHKAKGLEFPVVFLADMSRSLGFPERNLFTCDPKTLSLGCKLGEYKSAAYRAIQESQSARELEESVRLLYVALTRAREHLVLCASAGGSRRGENWADMALPHLGITMPEGEETRIGPGGITMKLWPMDLGARI